MTKNLDKNMNLYELTYLISPKITNDEAEEFNKEIISLLKDAGATLYKIDDPKKRSLAYEIKSFGEAYLASIDLDIEPEKVKIIEEKLKRKDNILRFLIVSKDKLEEKEEEKEMNNEPTPDEPEDDDDSDDEKGKDEDKEDKEEDKKGKKEDKVKLNEIDEKIDEIL